MKTLRLAFVGPHIQAVHDDRLTAGLLAKLPGAQVSIQRASHVEPKSGSTEWEADMSPTHGPTLGPFPSRAAALTAEVDWINAHALGRVFLPSA